MENLETNSNKEMEILSDINIKFLAKIFNIQQEMNVKKENNNGKYKFKSIGDIYEILKPLLSKEKIFINFSQFEIFYKNDVRYLTLKMMVVDLETGYNETIKADIEIDEKMMMNQMQKIISAKTFLKKTMLDDYFIISEDDPEFEVKNLNNNYQNKKQNIQSNTTTTNNKNIVNRNANNKVINQSQKNLLDLKIKESVIADLTQGYKMINEMFKKTPEQLTTKELNQFLEKIKAMKVEDIKEIQKQVKNLAIEILQDKNLIIETIKSVMGGKEIKINEIDSTIKLYELKAKILKHRDENENNN